MAYLDHLERMADDKTWRRKLDYLRFNFDHEIGPGHRVLEIGPGRGEFVAYAAERRVVFVDVVDDSPPILERLVATGGVRRCWLASVQDLEKIDAELEEYDRIVLVNVLEHIARPAIVPVLRSLYRHLSPGGRLLATVPNGANPLGVVERYADFTHETLFTEESLRQLVDICDLPGATAAVRGYRIPPVDLLNRVRIVAQSALHLLLKTALVVNGGVYFSLYHPNITLVLSREASAGAARGA